MGTSFHVEKHQEGSTLEIAGSILWCERPLLTTKKITGHIYITH